MVQNLAAKNKTMAIVVYLPADCVQENVTHTTASAPLRLKLLFQETYPFTE